MIKIPYVVKGRTLMKEGKANEIFYSGKVLEDAVGWLKQELPEEDLEYKNRDSLFYDHDDSCGVWLGEVRNYRYDEEKKQIVGDLWVIDRDAAEKLDYMIQNDDSKWGISPKLQVSQSEKGEVLAIRPKSWAFVLHPAGGKELMLAEKDEYDEDEEFVFSDLEEDEEKAPVALLKMEEEEQYVLGVVVTPDIPDAHGDTYSGQAIKNGAHLFWTDYNKVFVEHRDREGKMPGDLRKPDIVLNGYKDIQVVDSFVLPHEMVICGRLLPADTWLAGLKIYNPAVWQKVKEGKLNTFSLGGYGIE
jgi:hypothetical protein